MSALLPRTTDRPPRSSARLAFGIALLLVSAACFGAAGFGQRRNAWSPQDWPRYACLHEGRFMVFSTLWRRGGEGGFAWQSDGWIYDCIGDNIRAGATLRPDWVRVGDAYSGTPPYTAWIDAVTIPAWQAGVPPLLAGIVLCQTGLRRRPGTCSGCGYLLQGLPAGSRCPECGR